MDENKRNNVLDNVAENNKMLGEILIMAGEIKARINGSMPLAEKCKECPSEQERNTLGMQVGKQKGIITDIFEELRIVFDSL